MIALALWGIPWAVAAPAPVTLRDLGDRVEMGNGAVSFAVNKQSGNFENLQYAGQQILSEPAYLDWQSGGNNHIARGEFRVVADPAKNGGEMAEVCVARSGRGDARSPFDVELHYVLRAGDSGPYAFAVFSHPKDYPAGDLGQSRWVLRLRDEIFDVIQIDPERRRPMPPSSAPCKVLGPKESMQITEGPFAGLITDKYHFFVDAGDHFFHGWSGDASKIGCWLLWGSNEALGGGPTKQTNAAHFGRMLLKILTCGHYGSGGVSVAAGEEWRKVYGPWMLYLNSGRDRDGLWSDAAEKASALRASWPPPWMARADFPGASDRAEVSGKLRLAKGAGSSAGAWVGLAAASPDWQKQAKGYQFWARAGADGVFRIPSVRAGDYTLYAFAPGVFGEFRRDGLSVKPGQKLDLGEIEWKPESFGRTLWQIGVPDRSAKEFRHGDDFRRWGLWKKFPEDFPSGVSFVVGESSERKDWNYAQVNVEREGQWVGTTWKVLFYLPSAPSGGTATLRVALASATAAVVDVSLNGGRLDHFRTGRDNAMMRAGIHGQYALRDIRFDAALLKKGRNELSFTQEAGGNALKSVMYDCIRLELDEARAFVPERPRAAGDPAPADGEEGE